MEIECNECYGERLIGTKWCKQCSGSGVVDSEQMDYENGEWSL